MFSHDSTDNLLDNLESELTELVELDEPKSKTPSKEKISSSQVLSPPKTVRISSPPQKQLPVPAKRSFLENSPEKSNFPVPALRKVHSLDKKGKNNENEIIQMTTLHSDHASASSDVESISRQNTTVISLEEKKKEIKVVHEVNKISDDESFFVIKHGKWAEEVKLSDENEVCKDEVKSVSEKSFKPTLEVISEKKPKNKKKKKQEERRVSVSSGTSITHKSVGTSTDSSSLEESPKPKKKVKKEKTKKKKDQKKKLTSEEVTPTSATTEASVSKKSIKKQNAESSEKALGILINNTGSVKFNIILRNPRIKISFFNEDNGKQIGESFWTKAGILNNDFHNLQITWNETIRANYDLKRLRELYNNFLIFFEMINVENVNICWAFLRLFSPNSLNIDQKFTLQFFEYQQNTPTCFPFIFKKSNLKTDWTIFEQWQMNRKKFFGTLNISIKDMNCSVKEVIKKEVVKSTSVERNERMQQWSKIPGQACKIPNKIFHKIPLHENCSKGSLYVKFSNDGNLLAFAEISRDCFLLHIYKFPEMQKSFSMLEHSNFIHDIDWLKQKNYSTQKLVTASSDFTAIVWKLEADSYTYTILPHPAFVYAAKFLQKEDSETVHVVTAGRDAIIRIWRNRADMKNFELIQELKHPIVNKFTYITAIVTRNSDTFYTSSSTGEILEWTLQTTKDYHLNRNFRLMEIKGKIINNMDLNPRGNKIYFRIQDATNLENSNSIFVLGIPTGEITQKFQQLALESQGKLKVTPCGTQIFATNEHLIRHYQVSNGNLSSPTNDKNFINLKFSMGNKGFVSAMDYHPKDFYFACAIYGNHGGIVICSYETKDKDPIELLKSGSQELLNLHRSLDQHQIGSLNNIIRRLDEVFLSQTETTRQNNFDENTFTINNNSDSKRSRTYTVSQGPATFTIQKNCENNTYEIQRNENSDDDTTISESFN